MVKLVVLRGTGRDNFQKGTDSKDAVDAAFYSLGPQLSSAPGSALQGSQPPAQFQVQLNSGPTQRPAGINSHITPASRTRHEETFQDGNTTTNITRETTTGQFGDTSFTQRTTQRVSTTSSTLGPTAPASHQRRSPSPMARQPGFQGSNFNTSLAGAPKPAMWSPASNITVSTPSNVSVTQHPDQSITMSIGIPPDEGKENIAPSQARPAQAPMFTVSKVSVDQPKGIWTPAGMAPPAPRPPPPAREPSPRMDMPQRWAPSAPAPMQPRQPSPQPLGQDVPLMPSDFRRSDEVPMHIDVQKILREPRDSECSTPDSPGTAMRKKKIYADSSFYDDPEHKYPTIEEQIKMARKVAMSLMAPQNVKARGQRMFMKRRQKSARWVAGTGGPEFMEDFEFHTETEDVVDRPSDDMYYRPSPWQAPHTWQPELSFQQQQQPGYQPFQQQQLQQPQQPPQRWGQSGMAAPPWQPPQPSWEQQQPQPSWQGQPNAWQPSAPAKPPSWETPSWTPTAAPPPPPPPPPPPLPDTINPSMWRGPAVPFLDELEEKAKTFSANEIERMRLYDKKTLHNQISPQICFSLAEDLRQMKGRGGKLFAKRRAKAEQWVVDDKPSKPPSMDIMAKIVHDAGVKAGVNMGQVAKPKPVEHAALAKPRLQDMIDKPSMSPWQAATSYGSVDAAFSHLDKRHTVHGDSLVSNLSSAAAAASPAKPSFMAANESQTSSMFPDYNRKIRGWGSISGPKAAPQAPCVDYSALKRPTASDPDVSGASYAPPVSAPGSRPSGKGPESIRPVIFKNPTPQFGAASGAPPYWQDPAEPQPPSSRQPHDVTQSNGDLFYDTREVNEEQGYCDL